jgi:hypothetical protein
LPQWGDRKPSEARDDRDRRGARAIAEPVRNVLVRPAAIERAAYGFEVPFGSHSPACPVSIRPTTAQYGADSQPRRRDWAVRQGRPGCHIERWRRSTCTDTRWRLPMPPGLTPTPRWLCDAGPSSRPRLGKKARPSYGRTHTGCRSRPLGSTPQQSTSAGPAPQGPRFELGHAHDSSMVVRAPGRGCV